MIIAIDSTPVQELRIRRSETGRIMLLFPNGLSPEYFDTMDEVEQRLDLIELEGPVLVDERLVEISKSPRIAQCGRLVRGVNIEVRSEVTP